ncbi:POK9 protein, partial [Regulus satrapa]|nr:POK9 protein [Regulus satrapa]
RGSLGLDLAATVDVTLIDNRPQKVSTGVKGPLIINGQAQSALHLGRSSSSLKGLFVLLGVIDSNFQGEICIIVQTQFPSMHIPKGSKFAQLVPLQQLTDAVAAGSTKERGVGGFGFTGGLALLTIPMNHHPVVSATLVHEGESLQLPVLLDTGADLTLVS